MRNVLLAATAACALAASSGAHASNIAFTLENGASSSNIGTDNVSIGPVTLGGVSVTLSTGSRTTLPNGLQEQNINIDNLTSSVQTLYMLIGANDYLGSAGEFKLSGTIIVQAVTGHVSSADVTGSYFVSPTNFLNGDNSIAPGGTDIRNFDSLALIGPGSFSFNGLGADKVSGPYGLAESLTLTLQPFSEVGVQGIGMTAIPELPSWAMGLGGFGLLGLLTSRRQRGQRAVFSD